MVPVTHSRQMREKISSATRFDINGFSNLYMYNYTYSLGWHKSKVFFFFPPSSSPLLSPVNSRFIKIPPRRCLDALIFFVFGRFTKARVEILSLRWILFLSKPGVVVERSITLIQGNLNKITCTGLSRSNGSAITVIERVWIIFLTVRRISLVGHW